MLGTRLRLDFRCGTSTPSPSPDALQPFLPTLPKLDPFSALADLHPSTSLSSLAAFSFASLSSLSALRAVSWLVDSDACSSSIVESSLLTFSPSRAASSVRCAFCLSLRSICDCRSLTTRSTLRTDRWDLVRSSSCVSSWVSS